MNCCIIWYSTLWYAVYGVVLYMVQWNGIVYGMVLSCIITISQYIVPSKFSTFSILFNAKLRYSSFFNRPTFSEITEQYSRLMDLRSILEKMLYNNMKKMESISA